MRHLAFASMLLVIAAPASANSVRDVPMFERVSVGDELTITSFGIVEDSRCGDRKFCSGNDRLTVAAVITYRGRDREVALTLGEPLQLEGGTLTLRGTATPASSQGAIRLKEYRLDFQYRPDRRGRRG